MSSRDLNNPAVKDSPLLRKIKLALKDSDFALTDWQIAECIYPDFAQGSGSNGARISNIRRLCQRDNEIIQISDRYFALRSA